MIFRDFLYVLPSFADKKFKITQSHIPDFQMNYFRRRIANNNSMRKIGVFGNDCEFVFSRVFPNFAVALFIVDIYDKLKFIGLPDFNFGRKICVHQIFFHTASGSRT